MALSLCLWVWCVEREWWVISWATTSTGDVSGTRPNKQEDTPSLQALCALAVVPHIIPCSLGMAAGRRQRVGGPRVWVCGVMARLSFRSHTGDPNGSARDIIFFVHLPLPRTQQPKAKRKEKRGEQGDTQRNLFPQHPTLI